MKNLVIFSLRLKKYRYKLFEARKFFVSGIYESLLRFEFIVSEFERRSLVF